MKQMQFYNINFESKTKEFAIAGTMLSLQLGSPWLFALKA